MALMGAFVLFVRSPKARDNELVKFNNDRGTVENLD